MRVVSIVLGVIFFLSPLAYTFLRLAEVIGPKQAGDAVMIGIIMWFICLSVGALLFALAIDLKNNKKIKTG